ncbi:hypothetical protein QU487_21400 [Crenobacter sp. SG2305]|uniref:hypothetical protein n=1 Tax=Crenobacter oryzisoli TaxID=3056844 RepID=UPI0025AAC401|nr:hypothetical protein [Crenobacter sp. SG2305]MDN0085261.1 hypothetical protein [Crenobacter sp. SG2305]
MKGLTLITAALIAFATGAAFADHGEERVSLYGRQAREQTVPKMPMAHHAADEPANPPASTR